MHTYIHKYMYVSEGSVQHPINALSILHPVCSETLKAKPLTLPLVSILVPVFGLPVLWLGSYTINLVNKKRNYNGDDR